MDNSFEEHSTLAQKIMENTSTLVSNDDSRSHLTSLSSQQTISIGFEDISYSVPVSFLSKEKKKILSNLNGLFKSGELTAIMGPSGSGKTSLLNVLSGSIKEGVSGTVFANGLPMSLNKVQIKSHSAYIMQENHLNPYFTPRETMLHAANLKLESKLNQKFKLQLVESLLERMSMCEAGNTPCRRLSGGERKRLSVCLELIDNPTVLYLDEPTSGLDSTNCKILVTKLKELAAAHITVICTIHQPSALILSMFHHLYFLHCGRTVYQGDVTSLLPFLSFAGLPCPVFHNPADYITDVVTGEFGSLSDKLIAANDSKSWREESVQDLKQDVSEVKERERKGVSEWFRYRCLTSHLCKELRKDWIVTCIKCALHAIVALVLGLVFYGYGENAAKLNINLSYFLITSTYISYTALMPAVVKFPSKLMVLKKEHFNNWYKFSTYFLAFLTIDIPVQLVFAGIFYVISYLLSHQILEVSRFCIFTAAVALETIISDMFGIIFGCVPNPVNGIFLGCLLLAFVTMFGGLLIPLKNFSTLSRAISSLTFYRYSLELKLNAIYGLDRRKLTCPDDVLYCHYLNPKIIFDKIGMEDYQVARDLTILTIYSLITILSAFFILRYCINKFH